MSAIDQTPEVVAERERCARHVGGLLDAVLNLGDARFRMLVTEIARCLRIVEQAIRRGEEGPYEWGIQEEK